jgi:hypothetical protein
MVVMMTDGTADSPKVKKTKEKINININIKINMKKWCGYMYCVSPPWVVVSPPYVGGLSATHQDLKWFPKSSYRSVFYIRKMTDVILTF